MRITVTPPFPKAVLAVGGELKNTVCLGIAGEAMITESHGDLSASANYRHFLRTTAQISGEFPGDDYVIGHDLHPAYLSTTHARQQPQRKVAVQHHHAHAVSCAVDARVALPVIGVVCDGTGYGPDGAIWGGEVLCCRADSFERLAHLDYFALPGGDAAARFTWRPALSLLRETFPRDWTALAPACFQTIDGRERRLVGQQLETGLNTPITSSLGRLFDATACLANVCPRNDYEGQAAIELQAAAGDLAGEAYSFALRTRRRPVSIDWRPMVREIMDDLRAGTASPAIAARFHETIAAMFDTAVQFAVGETEVPRVVLSGGCFLNERLRTRLTERLTGRGLQVAVHQCVSPGDAGLSLGQAFVASATAATRDLVRNGA